MESLERQNTIKIANLFPEKKILKITQKFKQKKKNSFSYRQLCKIHASCATTATGESASTLRTQSAPCKNS